jgi:hypothetical protein
MSKENKSKAVHRKLFTCLKRDIGQLNKLIHFFENSHFYFPLRDQEQRMLWIVNTLEEQQKKRYVNKTSNCKDRKYLSTRCARHSEEKNKI